MTPVPMPPAPAHPVAAPPVEMSPFAARSVAMTPLAQALHWAYGIRGRREESAPDKPPLRHSPNSSRCPLAEPTRSGAELVLQWRARTTGRRVLATGPGASRDRAFALQALAHDLLKLCEVEILLVDWVPRTDWLPGSSQICELVPGRLWSADWRVLLDRPSNRGSPPGESGDRLGERGRTSAKRSGDLLVLINGGAWEELDERVWMRPGAIDGVLDIRQTGDMRQSSTNERLRAAGVENIGSITISGRNPVC